MRTTDVARGEITRALLRGGVYSTGFLLVMLAMGLVESWWAVLAVPATLLIGFAFSGACMALTTYMRSWQDFEFVSLGSCRCSCSLRRSFRSRRSTACCGGWWRRARSTAASCCAVS